MPSVDWYEANRIILGWGPTAGLVNWRGPSDEERQCRETTQRGLRCRERRPEDEDTCARHMSPQPRIEWDGRREHVYFIEAGGLVKIGRSRNWRTRLRELSTMSPVPLQCLRALDAPSGLEPLLHMHFDQLRAHGEWFRFEGELAYFLDLPWQAALDSLPSKLCWAWHYSRPRPEYWGVQAWARECGPGGSMPFPAVTCIYEAPAERPLGLVA